MAYNKNIKKDLEKILEPSDFIRTIREKVSEVVFIKTDSKNKGYIRYNRFSKKTFVINTFHGMEEIIKTLIHEAIHIDRDIYPMWTVFHVADYNDIEREIENITDLSYSTYRDDFKRVCEYLFSSGEIYQDNPFIGLQIEIKGDNTWNYLLD